MSREAVPTTATQSDALLNKVARTTGLFLDSRASFPMLANFISFASSEIISLLHCSNVALLRSACQVEEDKGRSSASHGKGEVVGPLIKLQV
jgi:hypothetical protein